MVIVASLIDWIESKDVRLPWQYLLGHSQIYQEFSSGGAGVIAVDYGWSMLGNQ